MFGGLSLSFWLLSSLAADRDRLNPALRKKIFENCCVSKLLQISLADAVSNLASLFVQKMVLSFAEDGEDDSPMAASVEHRPVGDHWVAPP